MSSQTIVDTVTLFQGVQVAGDMHFGGIRFSHSFHRFNVLSKDLALCVRVEMKVGGEDAGQGGLWRFAAIDPVAGIGRDHGLCLALGRHLPDCA